MPSKNIALKVAIAATGRTQREVADEVGLNESRLSLIVNGHWNPDDRTQATLAATLGRTVDELWPAREDVAAA
jgi:transcriptional regulator with XRE-family HTH domain